MTNALPVLPPVSQLAWRCRRGMLELDLLLQGFLEHGYAQLPIEDQAAFVTLLGTEDDVLLEYLLGRMRPANVALARVVDAIRHAAHA